MKDSRHARSFKSVAKVSFSHEFFLHCHFEIGVKLIQGVLLTPLL